jgi:hypothetical protein
MNFVRKLTVINLMGWIPGITQGWNGILTETCPGSKKMYGKVKISTDQITWGPKEAPSDFASWLLAGELMNKGYRRTSNAYCMVARIDREDWLDVLARERHCSRADFYNVDGSGVSDQHRDYYVRCHSKDKLTVHPAIIRLIKSY